MHLEHLHTNAISFMKSYLRSIDGTITTNQQADDVVHNYNRTRRMVAALADGASLTPADCWAAIQDDAAARLRVEVLTNI